MTTEMNKPEGAEEFEDEGPREHMKAVEAENKNLREQVLTQHIEAIGLNTKDGLGVAIAEGYKGDFTNFFTETIIFNDLRDCFSEPFE